MRLVVAALLLATGAHAADAPDRAQANRIIDAALADNTSLQRFEYLCYRIGSRLSGSEALNQAVSWSVDQMKAVGLENVHTLPVKVPHWVRGRESAEMLAPLQKPLHMLGLGNSVSTPPGGIEAEVVVVSTFDELEKLGRKAVEGRIVLFDAPYEAYTKTVVYRVNGASRAARLGAVAALVRSITPHSLRDPHTGVMLYTAGDPKIPTAAVSVEDAIWIHHLTASGQRVRLRLSMEAHFEPDADSADVIGEIRGTEKPDEVVVIGGHLDSWDVGQGANDDGGGVMAALEAAALIRKLGLHPRRTIRVVFWTNEENGSRGGVAYRDSLTPQERKQHIAAIEMDGGAEAPIGFNIAKGKALMGRATAIGSLLTRIGAGQVREGETEADIEPLVGDGIPGLGLRTNMAHYFDYHHTDADTFDKIVPDEFRRCIATMAVMSYVLADWP